jgi:hypothetical protein
MDGGANYTTVLCPPSAPPPSLPPEFGTWSQQVPVWFWVMFVFTALFALAGTMSIARAVHLIYDTRRDTRALGASRGRDTANTLSRLEAQVSHMCEGL